MSGSPRIAPARGKRSRAESRTLVGRCGGIIQGGRYTSPTVLDGFSFLGGLAGIPTSLEGQPRVECRKTYGRRAKRTEIFGMGCSTPELAQRWGSPACRFNGRILLANLLQSSRSTFSRGSFLSFLAFKEGMWDTQISALGGSPTVSGRYLTSFPTESSSSSPSGRCLSLPLSLTRGVLGLRVLERRARMGAHGQTAMARGLTLRELLFSCTDEVLPCP